MREFRDFDHINIASYQVSLDPQAFSQLIFGNVQSESSHQSKMNKAKSDHLSQASSSKTKQRVKHVAHSRMKLRISASKAPSPHLSPINEQLTSPSPTHSPPEELVIDETASSPCGPEDFSKTSPKHREVFLQSVDALEAAIIKRAIARADYEERLRKEEQEEKDRELAKKLEEEERAEARKERKKLEEAKKRAKASYSGRGRGRGKASGRGRGTVRGKRKGPAVMTHQEEEEENVCMNTLQKLNKSKVPEPPTKKRSVSRRPSVGSSRKSFLTGYEWLGGKFEVPPDISSEPSRAALKKLDSKRKREEKGKSIPKLTKQTRRRLVISSSETESD